MMEGVLVAKITFMSAKMARTVSKRSVVRDRSMTKMVSALNVLITHTPTKSLRNARPTYAPLERSRLLTADVNLVPITQGFLTSVSLALYPTVPIDTTST